MMIRRRNLTSFTSDNKCTTNSLHRRWNLHLLFHCLFLCLWYISSQAHTVAALKPTTADEYLSMGDAALADEDVTTAIAYYQQGLQAATLNNDKDDNRRKQQTDVSLPTRLSLYTNLGTALSSIGKDSEAAAYYEEALRLYEQTRIDEENKMEQSNLQQKRKESKSMDDARLIAAQTAFFLGLVYEDAQKIREAATVYEYAYQLDPLHWAAMANLGALLQDHSNVLASKQQQKSTRSPSYAPRLDALKAYQRAYAVLTNNETVPTDPPPEPRFILNQLQYRIGMLYWSFQDDFNKHNNDIIDEDMDTLTNYHCVADYIKQAAETINTKGTKPLISCRERAAHAFSLARTYDPDHASAQHMLATVTADASLTRASNTYIQSLFDDYATTFEKSLVQELGYTGFARLRRGFDRAMLKQQNQQPTLKADTSDFFFDKVLDAGCGTGLVGEQFHNISGILIGVDLSAAILAQAHQMRPNLYNRTIADDVITVMRQEAPLSLIVAGDSFIYFGDLIPLLAAISDGLEVGGYAAFTLENVDAETEQYLNDSKGNDWRWQLTASGRFAHRKEYVIRTSQAHQLQTIHYEAMDGFRSEGGMPVRGHLFVLQKVPVVPNDEL
jgi:predicted TPR repeat methyltransferase/uncharacterized glyoxalase superfamily protein PhnB